MYLFGGEHETCQARKTRQCTFPVLLLCTATHLRAGERAEGRRGARLVMSWLHSDTVAGGQVEGATDSLRIMSGSSPFVHAPRNRTRFGWRRCETVETSFTMSWYCTWDGRASMSTQINGAVIGDCGARAGRCTDPPAILCAMESA